MIYSFTLTDSQQKQATLDFPIRHPFPIRSLLISWNGFRSENTGLEILFSLDQVHWHPYAYWGSKGQHSYKYAGEFLIEQDVIILEQGSYDTFYVRLKGSLKKIYHLNICVKDVLFQFGIPPKISKTTMIPFIGHSQLLVESSNKERICSPTSTFSVLKYLIRDLPIELLNFSSHCRDEAFDIYGNWVLNIAAASHFLGPQWICTAAYVKDFQIILKQLHQKIPTIVSVKGNIPNAAKEYSQGHLMVVIGVDEKHIWCMDPAFPTSEETLVAYRQQDFFPAWQTREQLCYLFFPLGAPGYPQANIRKEVRFTS